MMIGFRMDGHENMRDKVGWNSVEKQDHESMPNINRKICKSQIVMNKKLWQKKKKVSLHVQNPCDETGIQ